MEAINDFKEALRLLEEREILALLENGEWSFFALQGERVAVQTPNSSYRLCKEDFIDLFGKQTFVLYKPSPQEGISPEKDEEYYRWRHK